MESMRFVGMELIDMSSLGYSYPETPKEEIQDSEQSEQETKE